LDAFAAKFRVFTPERRGHDRTPDVEGPITFDLIRSSLALGPGQLLRTLARLCKAAVTALDRASTAA